MKILHDTQQNSTSRFQYLDARPALWTRNRWKNETIFHITFSGRKKRERNRILENGNHSSERNVVREFVFKASSFTFSFEINKA